MVFVTIIYIQNACLIKVKISNDNCRLGGVAFNYFQLGFNKTNQIKMNNSIRMVKNRQIMLNAVKFQPSNYLANIIKPKAKQKLIKFLLVKVKYQILMEYFLIFKITANSNYLIIFEEEASCQLNGGFAMIIENSTIKDVIF